MLFFNNSVLFQRCCTKCSFNAGSLGAHRAGQLSAAHIRFTWQCSAGPLNNVQQGPILVFMCTSHVFGVLVHTDEVLGASVVIMRCHEVSPVLPGPSWRTVVPGWVHQLWTTWRHVTDSTRCLVVVEVPFERVEGAHLVLSTINGRRVLPGVVVLGVSRCFRETDIIRSTSLVSVVTTANQSLNDKIQNIKFNARLSLVLVTF